MLSVVITFGAVLVFLFICLVLYYKLHQSDEQFLKEYGPWAVVVGASSGIGAALAENLAKKGFDLVLVARTQSKLDAVGAEIMEKYGRKVVTLNGDISDVRTVLATRELCVGIDVGLVIFNASTLIVGDFESSALEDKMALIDVNIKGATAVCDVFGTLLAERQPRKEKAGLLLVSSLAGITGSRGLALYAASKAFLTSLGGGLWSEWQKKGIAVRTCVLGPVDTPTLREHGVKPESVPGIVSAEYAANRCLRAFGSIGPRHIIGLVPHITANLVERILPCSLGVMLLSESARSLYSNSKLQ